MILKIVSGGQSGVDRAALDFALERSVPCGGWCPRGRLAEDGPIDPRYPLQQTPESDNAQRTDWNVRDSDATLVLHRGVLTGGTALTVEAAKRRQRPFLIFEMQERAALEPIREWLARNSVKVLNIAGPRESENPGVYDTARSLLARLLDPKTFPRFPHLKR